MKSSMTKILRKPTEPYPPISLIQLLFNELKKNKDHILLVDVEQNEEFTKDHILQLSLKLAEYFDKIYKLQPGDFIAIICKNRWEFIILTLTCVFLKCTFSPLNPNYTKYELNHALKILQPRLIVCESNLIPKIQSIELDITNNIILSLTKHKQFQSIEEILQKETNSFQIQKENINESLQRLCCVLFSSGTTGLPKGVMLTNANFVFSFQARRAISVSNGFTVLAALPLFHTIGLNIFFNTLFSKGKMIVLSKFQPRKYLEIIDKYKVQLLIIVPTIVNFLIESPLVAEYDLSSIVVIGSGGSPLSNKTNKELKEKLKVPLIYQGYGLTETTYAITYVTKEVPINSVGKLLPNMECKVIDVESGEILGANQQGEMWFRGPLILKGYLKNQKATDELFDKDGFMRTGDIGYFDNDGYLFIIDRIKELIKYKGFQVPPAELEGILLKHPYIQDAAVVGKPDPQVGELPVAFVVLNKQKSFLTPEQIISYVAEHVSSEKQLRGGVQFVSEIPRNDAGKILRRKLKEKLIQKSKL